MKLLLSIAFLLGMSTIASLDAQTLAERQAAERIALGEQQVAEREALDEELKALLATQLQSNTQRRAEMTTSHSQARQELGATLLAEVAAAATLEEKRALRGSVRSQAAALKERLVAEVRTLAQTLKDEMAALRASSGQKRADLSAKHKQEIADLVEKHKAEARGEG